MLDPNIIHTFIVMNPELSSTEAARELRKQHPEAYGTEEGYRTAVRRYKAKCGLVKPEAAREFTSDKKTGSVNWRELCDFANLARDIKSAAGYSQSTAKLTFPGDKALGIIWLSDLHALSYGTDHSNIVRIIDEILDVPGLMIGLVGDLLQMSIKLRSVQEVSDNILPPELQMMWLESFLDEIKDRVVCCGWGNHEAEREEKATGISMFKHLASRRVIYHSGIGHLDIQVGDQVYKIGVTHKVRGRSLHNPVHGQQRYMRFEGTDREIFIAGDSHQAGVSQYTDGNLTRLAVNIGSTQIHSGYAQRYFSLYTHPVFPIVTLRSARHSFSADWTLKDWLERGIK